MTVISGYVIEPIRVGQSNGPYTQTPDIYVSNSTAFNAAYPSSETAPRTDYLVLVTSEGTTRPGLLESCRFGFSKNEIVDRFGYDAQAGAFRLLRGAAPIEVGMLAGDSNAKRLRVRPPVQATALAAAPYRLAVGSVGSGLDWSVTIVAADLNFNAPENLATRTAQLSMETGNLNWSMGDLTSYKGQRVRFQQQQFFAPKDSTGRLGYAPTTLSAPSLVLNPLPGPGQFPRIRFGYGLYLTSVEVTAFSGVPAAGTVEWLQATGELKFNAADAVANAGIPVYYDGVVFATSLALPSQSLGVINSPSTTPNHPQTIVGLPPTGGDLIFSVAGVSPYYRFPTVTYRAAASFDSGKKGEVQVDPSSGVVRFSSADRTTYLGKAVTLYIADVPIERGISVRFFRNPVNLDGALSTTKDVTRIYSVQRAKWADPIVASPQVSLPSLPIDASTYPRTVHVMQGQGTYVSDALRDMTASPQPGLGYYIDFDSGTLFFAQRKEQLQLPLGISSDVVLPDPLLLLNNLKLELGSGDSYSTLVIGDDVLVDTTSGVVSLASTNSLIVSGSATISGSTLTDLQAQFVSKGVRAGALVVLMDRNLSYTVVVDPASETALQLVPQPMAGSDVSYAVYEDREVLADRYFDEVVLVDPSTKVERISPTNDVRTLTPKVDYQLQPELGLVQFTDRLLTGEAACITYTVKPPYTTPPTESGSPVTENASFLIRKELTQAHPEPTSTLSFNPAGLTVALEPAPAVFRGGRPQKLGVQCTVDAALSQITFLADDQFSDALPHGAIVNPNERVYIDYYVTQAVGGEKTFTVLQPPILTAEVTINELDHQFKVHGDQTARFPGGYLLRIETEQIYLIGSSSYDVVTDETTVELYDSGALQPDQASQVFQDTFKDPKLYVSSGPAPIAAAPSAPAYFVTELIAYEAIARGSNTFVLAGDQTAGYRVGTVVLFTDAGGTFTDFLQVSGVAYDGSAGRTSIMLSANATRQYVFGQQLLLRSIRPIFEPPVQQVQTRRTPKLSQPHLVYRQVSGQAGKVLQPSEYTIDETGRIVFVEPLAPLEEFSICYTGLSAPTAGLNLRASYTSQITPSAANGLLGQTLLADYYIRSPDSFHFRVETMTNFRGEFAAEIASAASSGSSGPQTSNASQPKLWEQGRKSLYFDERHLANQDIIARTSLLYHNDLINSLEAYRRQLDGTVVGNNDGPFLFDGSTGHSSPPVANQIDDIVQVSTAYKKYYVPSAVSRFYPTAKSFFGITKDVSTAEVGTEVLDTKSTNVTQVSNLHFRQAWGIVTGVSGSVLKLDFASGDEPGFDVQVSQYARPPFVPGMKCRIVDRSGAEISASVAIVDVSDFQVTLGLAVSVPVGATIYQLQSDDSGAMFTHVGGRDYALNGETGQVTYVVAVPGDPPPNVPLFGSYSYSGSITLANTLTEPLKIPALFGGIEDDDGELSFPVQTPDLTTDLAKYLATESKLIRTGTGVLRGLTAERLSTGSVVAPNLSTIVDATVGSMSPAPLPGDLVRIVSGVNGGTGFRRITSVGPNYLITDATAPVFAAATNFSYVLVTAASLVSGTATSGTTSQLTSSTAGFLWNVKAGYTVVLTLSGVNYRRQISALTNTTLSFYPNVPSAVAAGTPFRVVNPLATYGNRSGTGSLDSIQEWDSALANEQALYVDKQSALQSIIDQAMVGVEFFGLSQDIVTSLTALKQSIPTLTPPLGSLRAKLVPALVVGFDAANTFVMDLLKSDLDARETQLSGGVDPIAKTIVAQLVDIMASTEKLYDKRYVWIDARINLESGLLVRQEAAVRNRQKAQAEVIKQLTKLLAVRSA